MIEINLNEGVRPAALCAASQPSDNNNPTITLYISLGITIIFLSCLVSLPHPTPEGKSFPHIVKAVQEERFNLRVFLVKVE